MLKCCARPLVTLVLVLVATCALSTLGHARVVRSSIAPGAAVQVGPQRPLGPTSGEPDQPAAPPPSHYSNGIVVPNPSSISADGELVVGWWTSWLWAFWLARAAL
jgi:hypothetical protein